MKSRHRSKPQRHPTTLLPYRAELRILDGYVEPNFVKVDLSRRIRSRRLNRIQRYFYPIDVAIVFEVGGLSGLPQERRRKRRPSKKESGNQIERQQIDVAARLQGAADHVYCFVVQFFSGNGSDFAINIFGRRLR